jgi:hypothetical protein
MNKPLRDLPFAILLIAIALPWLLSGPARSQELEPRGLTNLPVGMNFAVAAYGYSFGNVLLDPAVPIEDLEANVHSIVGAYVRAIDVFGMSGKFDVVVPFAAGDWEGIYTGIDTSATRNGIGDPRFRLSVSFIGSPALKPAEFGSFRQGTIVGASLQVIAPLGQYYPERLINLGSNRWTFRPQLGISRTAGNWIFEAYTALWIFTDNPEFWDGNYLEQYPLATFKTHIIHTMPKRRIWMALDAGYGIGGRTKINGVEKDTRISTFRFGVTFALPVAKRHTLKLSGFTGVRVERGPDFNAVVLSYQYRWGI